MANVMTQSLKDRYLKELSEDEFKITEAADAYEQAKSGLDVTLRRYIALRDFVTEQIGESPYFDSVKWPFGYGSDRGSFRFTGKPVGVAILEALRERRQVPDYDRGFWMTLDEIIEALSAGGLGFPEPIQARAVNAALLKTGGIRRAARVKNYVEGPFYMYIGEEGGESDQDELPLDE